MSKIMAVKFNGWNFGFIYDWTSGKQGIYTADFRDVIEVNGETMHRNDWIVKNEDGTFTIMSNLDFQNRLDEEYKRS